MKRPNQTNYPFPSVRVSDVPNAERPREQFERLGAEHVSNQVLLAIVLRSGVKGASVIEVAERLLYEYGSLCRLARASVEELSQTPGMGHVKAQVLKACLVLAQRLVEEKMPERLLVDSPVTAARTIKMKARAAEEEIFWAILLDRKNRLLRPPVEVAKGSLDMSIVHPREVFKEAVRASSASLIVIHNHPSGDPTPSREDMRITERLAKAGKLLGIDLVDHIIIGTQGLGEHKDYFSFQEEGLIRSR